MRYVRPFLESKAGNGSVPSIVVWAIVVVFLFCGAAYAAQPVLTADSLVYEESSSKVFARGNVELANDSYVMKADEIVYDRTTDVARAQGSVAVLSRKTGEILYADEMEVASDLKQGFLGEIGILFPDGARLAARAARRYEGRYLVASRGVYSACALCKEDPRAAPLWQVKAEKVTHDSVAKDVIYRNAFVEFWGIPVLYTPYFSHPDPSVSRRQGFLMPVVGMDSTLGPMARVPYYFDLAPNSDLLLTPTFSREDRAQLAAAWRHKFTQGKLNLEGSVVSARYTDDADHAHGERLRGHLFGNGIFNVDNNWRVGSKIAYASDKGYLNRYDVSSDDLLVNRLYAEFFKGRSYAVGDVYYFQDMRPGTRLAEPLVAPDVRVSALGEPGGMLGGRWSLGGGMLVTARENTTDPAKRGPSTRRVSVDAGWRRQMVAQAGFLTTVSASARADAYWASDVPRGDGATFADAERVRPFVQGDVSVRYPLSRRGDGYEQIIEPIALLSVAPRVRNAAFLPNEDSLDVDFDETNLFSSNRFSGIDRIEGGTRAAYGLRHAFFGDDGGKIEMLAGQVFRFKRDETFTQGSGLQEKFSDYVGRVYFEPVKWVDVDYGFRLDRDNLDLTRQEARASIGTSRFKPYLKYLALKQSEGSATVNQRIEEGTAGATVRFGEHWTLSGFHTRAMAPMPGPRETGAGLSYKDECLDAKISLSRDYMEQVDVSPGMTVFLRLNLRTIGGIDADY